MIALEAGDFTFKGFNMGRHEPWGHLTKIVEGDVEFLYVDEHRPLRDPHHLFIA